MLDSDQSGCFCSLCYVPGSLCEVVGSRWVQLWERKLLPHSPYIPPSRAPLDGSDMTTGECCHLPGSLCDCTGNAALSKTLEELDNRRAQYVTQVTAKDGRLLSTVIKALGTQRWDEWLVEISQLSDALDGNEQIKCEGIWLAGPSVVNQIIPVLKFSEDKIQLKEVLIAWNS